MSMQSLVEFDHNAVHEIKERPAEFAALLYRVCSGGYCEEDDREELWRFGVRYAGMKHSSSKWPPKTLERLP